MKLIFFSFLLLMVYITFNPVAAYQKSHFQLYVFNETMTYSDSKVWESLKNIDLNKNIFVITEHDIEIYNWSNQSITLNQQFSDKLIAHIFKGNFSKEKKHTWSKFEYALYLKQFLVLVNGKRLYGGLFIYPGANTFALFPVVYPQPTQPEMTNGKLVKFKIQLLLRPSTQVGITHSPLNYKDFDLSQRKAIEVMEIYDLFDELGKLVK